MDWRSEYETDRAVLWRIVTLLFSLAEIAHQAGSRTGPVRWLVVHILRKAEGVAREFVFGPTADDAKDPTDLATSFRRMALSLRNTLRRLRRALSCRVVRNAANALEGHRRPVAALFANGTAFAGPPYPDTS